MPIRFMISDWEAVVSLQTWDQPNNAARFKQRKSHDWHRQARTRSFGRLRSRQIRELTAFHRLIVSQIR
jgi:hypothetical protein